MSTCDRAVIYCISGSRQAPPPEPEVDPLPEADDASVARREAKTFDNMQLALHGADGKPCRCPVCLRVKQRRHYAKSESHPHAEARIRRLPGAHTFGSIATYSDTIDYGPEANFMQGARYDLFGYDVSTSTFLTMPMRDKSTRNKFQIVKVAYWS